MPELDETQTIDVICKILEEEFPEYFDFDNSEHENLQRLYQAAIKICETLF